MMTFWFISLLLMALISAYMAAWWGENKPCHQCMSTVKRDMPECDGCGRRAYVHYCVQCLRTIYKKRTPRIKKFLALLERIKKIRRSRKNK